MGKKQTAAQPKPRAGLDIKQFLQRKVAQTTHGPTTAASLGATAAAAPVAAPARVQTPGRHLLDNVLLSQDVDEGGVQVVWASSPTGTSSQPKGVGVSQEAPSHASEQHGGAPPPDSSQGSKDGFRRTLLQAVQRAAAVSAAEAVEPHRKQQQQEQQHQHGAREDQHQEVDGQAVEEGDAAGLQAQQGDGADLLEQLLARRSSHGAASTSVPTAARPGPARRPADPHHPSSSSGQPPLPTACEPRAQVDGSGGEGCTVGPVRGRTPGPKRRALQELLAEEGDEADEVMAEVLASADAYTTPGGGSVGSRSRCGLRGADGRSLAGTPAGLGGGGTKRMLLASGKKPASGNKRRALLDLLDQVELMVKHRSSTGTCAGDRPGSTLPPTWREPSGRPTPSCTEPSAPGSTLRSLPPSAAPSGPAGGGAALPPSHGSVRGVVAPSPAGAPAGGQQLTSPPFRLRGKVTPESLGYKAARPRVLSSATPDEAGAPGGPDAPVEVLRAPDPEALARARSSELPPPFPLGGRQPAAPGGAPGLDPQPAAAIHPAPCPAPQPALELPAGHAATATSPSPAPLAAAPTCSPPSAGSSPVEAVVVRPPLGSLAPPPSSASVLEGTDDDDELFSVVDIDALVASVTARQSLGAPQQTQQTQQQQQHVLSQPGAALTQRQGEVRAPGAAGRPAACSASQQRQAPHPSGCPPARGVQAGSAAAMPPAAPAPPPTAALSAAVAPCTAGAGPSCSSAVAPLAAAVPPPAAGAAPDPVSELLGDRAEVHYRVLEVDPRDTFTTLRCWNEYKNTELCVHLEDVWVDLPARPGDAVNVLGGWVLPGSGGREVRVSSEDGLVVLHPDLLLSGTAITNAMQCPRKAWLSERVASGPGGEAALMGTLSHQLLQRTLQAALEGSVSKEDMLATARVVLAGSTEKLAEAGLDEGTVLGRLSQQVDPLVAWCRAYVTPDPSRPQGAPLERMAARAGEPPGRTFCRVAEVVDIEESIWAPKYGLKGMLDATLRVQLSTQDPLHNQRTLAGGHASAAQQAQQAQQAQRAHTQGPGQGWGQQGQQGQQPQRFHGRRAGPEGGVGPGPGPGPGAASHAQGPGQQGAAGPGWHVGVGQGHHGQGQGGQLRRQHSWSAGAATVAAAGTQAPGAQGQPALPLQLPGYACETAIVPFEFKSGKQHTSHRAQVLLYLLLTEDRYRTAVRTGLLWNLQQPNMQAVDYRHGELAALLMHRNRLAAHLAHQAGPPPEPLYNDRECTFCTVSATCALYAAAQNQAWEAAGGAAGGGGVGGGAGRWASQCGGGGGGVVSAYAPVDVPALHEQLREQVERVRGTAAAFFAHWVRLVDREEVASRGNQAEIWAISGAQREQQGGCIARLQLLRTGTLDRGPDGTQYLYVFGRTPPAAAGAAAARAAAASARSTPGSTPHAAAAAGQGPMDVDSGPGALAVEAQGAAAAAGDVLRGDEGRGSLLDAGFAPGDRGILGVEGRHTQAARVTVAEVTEETMTLASDKELRIERLTGHAAPRTCTCASSASPQQQSYHHQQQQQACGRCGGCRGEVRPVADPRVTWRLDKDEAASTFAQMRLNLAKLCVRGAGMGWQDKGGSDGGGKGGSGGGGGAAAAASAEQRRREAILQRLQELVVGLDAPKQGLAHGNPAWGSQALACSAPSQAPYGGSRYLAAHAHLLNAEQLEAVQRVLAMQDYAVLLGMPGTGKTTTIVHIIRALVERNVTVLVASYTNSAVDNILLKLVGCPGVNFVRLGQRGSVHPGVRPYMPGGAAHPDTSVAGLRDTMQQANVVGCTCLSTHSALLAGRTFGVAILDEASQVNLPASLGPLMLGRSFLLVGDHYQLNPLVVSREAAQGGLGVSLFRRLSEAHPQAVVTLRSQYRMASDIMLLSNTLVYNGRLLCGSAAVARGALQLPRLDALLAASAAAAAAGAGAGAGAAGCDGPSTSSQGLAPAAGPATPELPGGAAGAGACGALYPAWLLDVLHPDRRVVFLDTDGAGCGAGAEGGCREVLLGDGVTNPGEVRLLAALAGALQAAGLPAGEIGVASPYRAQVAALSAAMAGLGEGERGGAAELVGAAGAAGSGTRPEFGAASPTSGAAAAGGGEGEGAGVEVLTIDRFQGRDKQAILLSFVRSNPGRNAGRLLADWQRLNVAVTRARCKLLMVGSASTLESTPLLADMLRLLRGRGWVLRLPAEGVAGLPPVATAAGRGGPGAR